MTQNFHKFQEKISLRENIILNITAYSVIVFFDAFLINCEITKCENPILKLFMEI